MSTWRSEFDRKLVVEFSIIVVGVFVALAAESWWSEREERRLEREIREDMIVEFESNVRILEADIAENLEARKRIEMLKDLSDDELLSLTDTAISDVFVPYLEWAGFDPEMGSTQAFVESGNVGAISNRELRLLLSQWAGLLEFRRRLSLQAVDFQHQAVSPFIARAASDQTWSEDERRELRTLMDYLSRLHGFVLSNQYELQTAAKDIAVFLSEER